MGSLPTPPADSPATLSSPADLSSLPPFEMSFSLHLECQSCVDSVRKAVQDLPGILTATPSLETQTLLTLGSAAPSVILAAIQSTGRDAVVRGSGVGDGSGTAAAVAILEDYDTNDYSASPVRGLARIVQVRFRKGESQSSVSEDAGQLQKTQSLRPDAVPALSIIDISLSGLRPGNYTASVRQTGDISRGSQSVGGSWREIPGEILVGKDGRGNAVVVGSGWEVWEVVGRAFAVSNSSSSAVPGIESESRKDSENEDKQMVLGVIARSAGVWDNDKSVCSCSGKTVWEERVEQKGRGML